jgi:hypothetical protein
MEVCCCQSKRYELLQRMPSNAEGTESVYLQLFALPLSFFVHSPKITTLLLHLDVTVSEAKES